MEFDDELRTLVADMIETNDAANGVGLAAPQIGVGLQVFIWKMPNEDGVPESGHIVNPIVTTRGSQERPLTPTRTPKCACPCRASPTRSSERRRRTSVNDVDGNRLEFDTTGWFARCMQHEYDHLNGTLYVDRLDERQSKKARKAVKRSGWGRPGHSHPGVDPTPSATARTTTPTSWSGDAEGLRAARRGRAGRRAADRRRRRPDGHRKVRPALDLAERLGGEVVNADAMQPLPGHGHRHGQAPPPGSGGGSRTTSRTSST